MKAKLVFKDRAGNKLYKRFIKTRGIVQFSAKNAKGKLVNTSGVKSMLKRAGIGNVKIKKNVRI
jgi:hypothetical protein